MAEAPSDIRTMRVGSLTGTTGERWPHLIDATGSPLLQDTGVWGVVGVDLGATCQHGGRTFIFFGDVVATQGAEQFVGSDLVAWSDEPVVLRNGGHQYMGLRFLLPVEPFATEGEKDWRFCTSCHSLVLTTAPVRKCVGTGGGNHTPMGLPFRIPFKPTEIAGQPLWRRCTRCATLFFSGYGASTPQGCPAGGVHVASGDREYVLPTVPDDGKNVPAERGQPDWRYCVRCAGLFWNGEALKGVCAGSPGGGIRLHAVLNDERLFDPFRVSAPIGELQLNETPNAAFSFEDRVYVFAGTSFRPRVADPAPGQYLCSKSEPAVAGEYETEFLFSPRLGCCGVDMPAGERSPSLLSHVPLGFKFVLPQATNDTPAGDRGWRICTRCEALFRGDPGTSAGACQQGGAHVPRAGYEFALRRDFAGDHEHQPGWRHCGKCAALFWIDPNRPADTGRCPGGDLHAPLGDVRFAARHAWRQEDAHNQPGWRFCTKCHGLFFMAYVGKGQGVCPRGGEHAALGLEFVLLHGVGETQTQQTEWRFCDWCFGLFYNGYTQKGFCPHPDRRAKGHKAEGFVFSLPHHLDASSDRQSGWRFCRDCYGLFFAPYGTGLCPKTGEPHFPEGWDFHLPAHGGVDPDRSFRFCVRCRCMFRYDYPIDVIKGHALDLEEANWAPWLAAHVIDNRRHARDLARIPGAGATRHGLAMLGYDGFTFRLAWMPLAPGKRPRFDTIRYYHRGKDAWTDKPDLSASSHLFANERLPEWRWSHVSMQWIEPARRWIVVYQKANGADFSQPVVARIGLSLFDWSEEFVLFEPRSAWDRYMHRAGVEDFYPKLPPVIPNDGGNGFAYGAFILDRYTLWDPAERTVDLFYLLSTWIPYQVHLMHSRIVIPRESLLDLVLQLMARLARWLIRGK